MRARPSSPGPAPTPRPADRRPAGLVAALLAVAGCATPALPTSTTTAAEPVGRVPEGPLARFVDPRAGVAFDAPEKAALRLAEDSDTRLALGEPDLVVSVFHEHFEQQPTRENCWARLEERVRGSLPADRLPTGKPLRDQLAEGLERGGHRVLHVIPGVRALDCVIVTVEGPRDVPVVQDLAAAIRMTLTLRPPEPEVAARLDLEAGMQLLSQEKYSAALARLERSALVRADDPRVRRAAGLAAFFASGKLPAGEEKNELVRRAVGHLSEARKAWRSSDGVLVRPFERDDDFLRDVLMYLGLARASLGDFAEATSTLGELVVRHPEDAIARYNFACALALSGDGDEAMVQLAEAVKRDPQLGSHAREDSDLVSLRGRGDFEQLVTGGVDRPDQR